MTFYSDTLALWVQVFNQVFDLFNQPLVSVIQGLGFVSFSPAWLILEPFFDQIFGSITLFQFILGFGIFVYIAIQLVSWIIGIVT